MMVWARSTASAIDQILCQISATVPRWTVKEEIHPHGRPIVPLMIAVSLPSKPIKRGRLTLRDFPMESFAFSIISEIFLNSASNFNATGVVQICVYNSSVCSGIFRNYGDDKVAHGGQPCLKKSIEQFGATDGRTTKSQSRL
jgi:hypothetical protein